MNQGPHEDRPPMRFAPSANFRKEVSAEFGIQVASQYLKEVDQFLTHTDEFTLNNPEGALNLLKRLFGGKKNTDEHGDL